MADDLESGRKAMKRRVLILGAAGRDFHNFNVVFRGDPTRNVTAMVGNPFLRPQFTNVYEAGFSRSWPGGTGSAALYHRDVSDAFLRQKLLRQVQFDQYELFRIQNQISTGRRIERPSQDAPVAPP